MPCGNLDIGINIHSCEATSSQRMRYSEGRFVTLGEGISIIQRYIERDSDEWYNFINYYGLDYSHIVGESTNLFKFIKIDVGYRSYKYLENYITKAKYFQVSSFDDSHIFKYEDSDGNWFDGSIMPRQFMVKDIDDIYYYLRNDEARHMFNIRNGFWLDDNNLTMAGNIYY